MRKYGSVMEYIDEHDKWKELLMLLREVIISTGLYEETIKWGMPTYTVGGKNVLGIGAFKNHLSLLFHHGSFLKDHHSVLLNAQEGKTKGMRQ